MKYHPATINYRSWDSTLAKNLNLVFGRKTRTQVHTNGVKMTRATPKLLKNRRRNDFKNGNKMTWADMARVQKVILQIDILPIHRHARCQTMTWEKIPKAGIIVSQTWKLRFTSNSISRSGLPDRLPTVLGSLAIIHYIQVVRNHRIFLSFFILTTRSFWSSCSCAQCYFRNIQEKKNNKKLTSGWVI